MGRRRIGLTAIIALAIVGFSVIKYCSNKSVNPVTGKTEYVSLTPEEEVALGLESRAQLAQQFGGLYPDEEVQQTIDKIGARIVANSDAARAPYKFEFHVLNDPKTVNAFALPGGQIFITTALLSRLKSEDQIAGVLGHEVGHVIERHSAERMAESSLFQGLGSAALILTGDASTQQIVGQVINTTLMAHGRDDELESDDLGVKYMLQSGYNPEDMIVVMDVLEKASGGSQQPEFMSTHPNPGNRREQIRQSIEKYTSAGIGVGSSY